MLTAVTLVGAGANASVRVSVMPVTKSSVPSVAWVAPPAKTSTLSPAYSCTKARNALPES